MKVADPYRIRMDDDPIMRSISREVTGPDTSGLIEHLIDVMLQIVRHRQALGLAAIQIGVPLRVIVIRVEGREMALINPVLERSLNRFAVAREGCLSILPKKWRNVRRPAKCDVTWSTLQMFEVGTVKKRRFETFTGLAARVMQHEIDHLDGVLMTDYPLAA